MKNFTTNLFLLLTIFKISQCSRILIIVPTPSISHNVIFHPIILKLLERGHDIVSITTEPLNDPKLTNLKEINVREISYNVFEDKHLMAESRYQKISNLKMLQNLANVLVTTCEVQLNNSEVQNLIHSNQKFDLLIVEYLVYPVFYHFKTLLNVPMVGITSMSLPLSQQDAIGGFIHPAFYLDSIVISSRNLKFWQRLFNFMYLFQYRLFYHYFYLEMQEELAKKYFGNFTHQRLWDLEKSVDLVLTNTNPIFNIPRAIVPQNVEIGGIHLKESKMLPTDLKLYLDNSTNGVIYFSLGSNVKSKTLPKDIREMFLRVFGRMNYNVLWKWENETLKNKPDHVVIQKWFPQQEILDHANVKLFITQGGLQSIEESIQSKVPMLVIPFSGDQPYNAQRLVDLEVAIKLEFEELNEINVYDAIEEIIQNSRYIDNIEKISNLWWDQPMKPLDRAIWWIEYVIRHNGTQFLRTPIADMPWYIYWMLDTISFIVGIMCLIFYLSRKMCRIIISYKKFKKD